MSSGATAVSHEPQLPLAPLQRSKEAPADLKLNPEIAINELSSRG